VYDLIREIAEFEAWQERKPVIWIGEETLIRMIKTMHIPDLADDCKIGVKDMREMFGCKVKILVNCAHGYVLE